MNTTFLRDNEMAQKTNQLAFSAWKVDRTYSYTQHAHIFIVCSNWKLSHKNAVNTHVSEFFRVNGVWRNVRLKLVPRE